MNSVSAIFELFVGLQVRYLAVYILLRLLQSLVIGLKDFEYDFREDWKGYCKFYISVTEKNFFLRNGMNEIGLRNYGAAHIIDLALVCSNRVI